jgi:ribosome maturation factor RimP
MVGGSMKDLEKMIYDEAIKIALPLNLTIEEVEYVKENGIKILRIIADKDGGLDIDDSAKLNELMSQRLDELDPIEEEYYLEVCSPGIEKLLKTKQSIIDHVGSYVFVKTYESIMKQKEWYGTIIKFENDLLTLNGKYRQLTKEIQIPYEKIAVIRTAVQF